MGRVGTVVPSRADPREDMYDCIANTLGFDNVKRGADAQEKERWKAAFEAEQQAASARRPGSAAASA